MFLLLLLLFWLRFCFKHKKWLIDYCSTVATKTNNFSSFPWCIWRGMLRPPSVMSLVFLVQFLFWVGKHSDAHTKIHTQKTHRIEMLTSYFIFYTRDFLSSACSAFCLFEFRLHLWHKYFIDSVLWIRLLMLLLLLFCVFITLRSKPVAMKLPLWACLLVFFLISCHLLFMLGNFFVSFFHLFSSASIDLRCTKNETNFKVHRRIAKIQKMRVREKERRSDMLTYRYITSSRRHHKWLAICW